ncbi:hypothetical protein ASPCAL14020 [Aspergillus calidoustus]|uniref:Fungal N-terminal domain-containing protein n=1 Tax=Aspergillus calidoustus TaxID=454130 RepID=A0A0U5GES1_ASPCI|nr:hypothetical protein ASPCAL14020 [Aspergillus calidoustus]
MSNSTGKILELSCDDSPLSVTGSIIGILTLAYAILATIVFLTTSLAGASQEKRQFAARLEGEIKSLELLIELLRNSSHLVPNDNGVARRLDRRLDQATKTIQDVMRQVFGDVFEWESPHRRHFRSRARFLSEKENLSQHFDHIVSHRTQLEAVFQGLMASMVIAEAGTSFRGPTAVLQYYFRKARGCAAPLLPEEFTVHSL